MCTEKLEKMVGKFRRTNGGILRDKEGAIIVGLENKLKRWQEYIQGIFQDSRTDLQGRQKNVVLTGEDGPEITKIEIVYAINRQNNEEAGPDQIHAEILKIMVEQNSSSLRFLTQLFKRICRQGSIP